MSAHGEDAQSARPVPIRETTARLIYQTWQHKMCDIGQGHMVYDWDYMPGDVRRTWEDSVSAILNWEYEGIVSGLADRLNTRAQAAKRALDVANFQARMRRPSVSRSGGDASVSQGRSLPPGGNT